MFDKAAFLDAATLAARQVGVLARRLQGQVKNDGKSVDLTDTGGNDYLTRQKEAVTAVDQIAQDIIITAVLPHLPPDTVLDGEEETPGKALMPTPDGDYVLVLDPIDGTLQYLEGKQTYSVNIGLFSKGKVEAAILYYPGLDIAYFTQGAGAFEAEGVFLHGLARRKPVHFAPQPANTADVFFYHAAPEVMKQDLRSAGFNPVGQFRTAETANNTLGILRGEVTAAVLEKIQVRDLMHIAILTAGKPEYMTDWRGNPLPWPRLGGAMPQALVSAWPVSEKLRQVLTRHAQ